MEKIRSRYSVLVIGSIDKVMEIAKRHGVTLKKGSFAGSKGYFFEVDEEVVGAHPAVTALRQSKETFGVSREHGMLHPPKDNRQGR